MRLFGNPLEFLPEILPLHKLRHLSLANIRIVADEHLRSLNVQIEVQDNTSIFNFFSAIFALFSKDKVLWGIAFGCLLQTENSSYFVASRHRLSAFFSLIFRFSSCHHPLLASALAKIMQDEGNRAVVGKDENAMRQLISMISSDNRHVVCWHIFKIISCLFFPGHFILIVMTFGRLNKLVPLFLLLPWRYLWRCN